MGLAIVNSIVQSESVGGKVDVWSEEGAGTEIKVTFTAEIPENAESLKFDMEPVKFEDPRCPARVTLAGFKLEHRGIRLLHSVIKSNLEFWGFECVQNEGASSDIVILDENPSLVAAATEDRDIRQSFVILSSARGDPKLMTIANEHERIGGFCRIIYKPGGPRRLMGVLKLALHAVTIARTRGPVQTSPGSRPVEVEHILGTKLPRRNSEETTMPPPAHPLRPSMGPRSASAYPSTAAFSALPTTVEMEEQLDPETVAPTITVGTGGSLLKSSLGTIDAQEHRFRVLVIEDNSILRNLL